MKYRQFQTGKKTNFFLNAAIFLLKNLPIILLNTINEYTSDEGIDMRILSQPMIKEKDITLDMLRVKSIK